MTDNSGTVLVIGASGFVGRNLVRALLAAGRSVRCLVRDASRVHDLADAGADVVEGDILDAAAVRRALVSAHDVYICIHTLTPQRAAAPGQDFMDVEVAGIRNVIRGCESTGVRRVVYVTSIGVAPDGPGAWVTGRSRIEGLLFSAGLDVTVLRPGMIVGRGGTGFGAVARGARGPVAVILGDGTQKFRTIAIDDLAYYLVGVLDDARSFGHHYDVGSDDVLTTAEMIDLAADHLGRRHPAKIRVPARLLVSAGPLLERLTRMPRGALTGLADSLQVDMTGDPTAVRELLDREPQNYREAAASALSQTDPNPSTRR